MKTKILSALYHAQGYVSGQELCDALSVSRTAVWKVINQLKEEGYGIEASTRKGYRIVSSPDVVTAEEVEGRLDTEWAGHPVVFRPVIDSTNNEGKRLAEDGAAHGTLVVAELQEKGKGRRGRIWTAPAGETVMMSLLLKPDFPPERASAVTLVMGLSVAMACRKLCGVDAQIKWPNDIVVDGKKVCGILTEMSSVVEEIHVADYLVIGVGINVNTTEFPPEIAATASSLRLATGRTVGRAGLIAECMRQFEQYYGKFLKTWEVSLLMDEYNHLLAGRNQPVRVLEPQNEYDGIARGINERGELLVERPDGTVEQVYAGEVSVRGIYGYV